MSFNFTSAPTILTFYRLKGICNSPAWIVSQCNQYAIDHGLTPFAVYQGSWNIMDRAFERDIIPMAREHGMAICAWNVLASGKLRSDEEEARREKSGEQGRDLKIDNNGWKRTEREKKYSRALQKVATQLGLGQEAVPAIAIAYVMHKAPYVFPIIGGRKTEHLHANIQALKIRLSEEQIQSLDSIESFDVGFPHTVCVRLQKTRAYFLFLNFFLSLSHRAMEPKLLIFLTWSPSTIVLLTLAQFSPPRKLECYVCSADNACNQPKIMKNRNFYNDIVKCVIFDQLQITHWGNW